MIPTTPTAPEYTGADRQAVRDAVRCLAAIAQDAVLAAGGEGSTPDAIARVRTALTATADAVHQARVGLRRVEVGAVVRGAWSRAMDTAGGADDPVPDATVAEAAAEIVEAELESGDGRPSVGVLTAALGPLIITGRLPTGTARAAAAAPAAAEAAVRVLHAALYPRADRDRAPDARPDVRVPLPADGLHSDAVRVPGPVADLGGRTPPRVAEEPGR
ncbi:hypothetical protein [Nocardiopsis trehalosi]|jgi:hypothetical protein|uniref:hypothetical protein n=1 Tax=Nocardiopsis trehalosi TaxID=109329 RepID=UPI0008325521|nr:hypothetical protein [Nocardiopsis trehalosi]